ncbi:enoyl-CoA hydratase [Niveispirillum sp. SYP-B3756]|uniref:enoyl-CoA hydratase n=1 Tax=Niveispirillum sp. SYP-B3756 TaxID=2662178 RepID=UPI0012910478|nr:enoyl-CoA hydratase [Niveispirillum sp. SYP-B3756]MQP68299.1 enoyl-CoA hydratase [Niveispirillum sp. SYP-B3756]
MTSVGLLVERFGPILRLSHDRPERRNAQSAAFLDALNGALDAAAADLAVRVVILAGTGDHFCAGHDLKDADTMQPQGTPETRDMFEAQRYRDYCLRLWDMPKPVIAQVQGACVGGGFMVANMCDLIVAAEDTFFADPVVGTAAVAASEVLVHPWVMGLRRAKEFLYGGGRVSATEALAMGMVNRVVPKEDLAAASLALAERIAQSSPFALRLMKRSLNRTAEIQGFRAAIDAHFDTHQLSHMGADAQERLAAGAAGIVGRGRGQTG